MACREIRRQEKQRIFERSATLAGISQEILDEFEALQSYRPVTRTGDREQIRARKSGDENKEQVVLHRLGTIEQDSPKCQLGIANCACESVCGDNGQPICLDRADQDS